MKWITFLLLFLGFGSLSAQQFSIGVGGLYQFKGDYIETIEEKKNSVRHLIVPDMVDSSYYLTLLTTIRETQHIFNAKPGWQVVGNFEWKFAKKLSLSTGIGLRGRSWDYDGKQKRFIFYEELIGILSEDEIPIYEPTLVCDEVIDNPNAKSPSELARLSILDVLIPLGVKIHFSEQFDMGVNVLFSSPINTLIRNEFTDTEFYIENDQQICENFLAEHEDKTGQYFENTRWSTELNFTYWMDKIGFQIFGQLSTTRLMEELPENGPGLGQIVTSDSFKPSFVGLMVQYKFGGKSNP